MSGSLVPRSSRRPRVLMIGLRGFPGVQGGVETHAEHICAGLSRRGWEVTAAVRTPYMRHISRDSWNGVRYLRIWSPKTKAFEALTHSLLAVLVAVFTRPDILHIQAIGPAIWTPIARLAGLRVVVTHHGAHYEWDKWSPLAKSMLRIGEALGMRFANQRIAISESIRRLVVDKYALPTTRIPNGVNPPESGVPDDLIRGFGLEPGRYFLLVGRLVAEKRHHDLIDAFSTLCLPEWKVAIVGSVDHPDDYSEKLKAIAKSNPSMVLTGFQSGENLAQLYAHAAAFVLPSSHEGLPIALLEALSHGTRALASDIPGNREIGLSDACYFPCGDVHTLASKLASIAATPASPTERDQLRRNVAKTFSWDRIADATDAVYRSALRHASRRTV